MTSTQPGMTEAPALGWQAAGPGPLRMGPGLAAGAGAEVG